MCNTHFENEDTSQQETQNGSAPVSRRGFLHSLATLSAGLTVAAVLPADAQSHVHKTRRPKLHRKSAPPARAKVVPTSLSPGPQTEARVHINQVGYLPHEPKRAVIPAVSAIYGNGFCLIDDDITPRIRYQGTLTAYEGQSGEKYGHFPYHYFADFDAFTTPGRYRLRLSDGRISVPFSIGSDLYARLMPLTLQYFAMQQCGGNSGSDWHGPCHSDDGVIKGGPRDGQTLAGHGGWHDAGDYLKFVQTTSYVTALMLFTAEHFPHLLPHYRPNHEMPPLLAHAKTGLDWLLRMHPTPDEFYFQVGEAGDHDSWRLPEDDSPKTKPNWKPRPVHYGIGANLAGRCAAAFALASRLYTRYDADFAARCLAAAKSVYALGQQNPRVVSTEPSDYYPETTWQDDMEWGAATLYRVTHERAYLEQALAYSRQAGAAHDVTSVYNTHALAHYELMPFVGQMEQDRLRDYLRTDAELARARSANPYGLAVPYSWGTSETAIGAALNCLLYARSVDSPQAAPYVEVARRQRDFVLGCNPFNLSFLVGAGTRYPLFPHHQVANIRKVELTGAIVGGPSDVHTFASQNITLNGAGFDAMSLNPPTPDDVADEVAVYHDAVQDYVTNEPAIDYTAKFLLLTAFYQPHHHTA